MKQWLIYLISLSALVLAVTMTGCATESKSVGLGGAIGVGTGAILGGIADPGKNGEFRTRNVIVGSALGGMAGMIAGSIIHEDTEKQKQEAFQKGQASAPHKPSGTMPGLKSAKVETHWIEGRISGNRYVEPHWEYVIVEPARWEDSQ